MTRPTPEQREAARRPDPHHRTVMHQRWENLLFLHWAIDPDLIQRTLPPGLHTDTFDGHGWLGIVPFAMRDVRPAGLPAVGPISNFLELNVRTYVHDERGVPGVWFYSLDCNQPVAVIIAQAFFSLPYRHAEMRASFGSGIDYRSTRRGTREEARYLWKPDGAAKTANPDTLEFFLLERYHLYSARGGRLLRGTVAHAPYRFQQAQMEDFSVAPATMAGFTDLPTAPRHICHSDGVDVRILGLERVK
jgi:uncharacterized protein YqjF (DUF2071 family)